MITINDPALDVTWETPAAQAQGEPESVEVTPEGVLPEAVSCTVREEINGAYELEMMYPVIGANSGLIQSDKILTVQVPLENSIGDNHFRIYRVVKDLHGHIYAYARQITADISCTAVGNDDIYTQFDVATFAEFIAAIRKKIGASGNMPFFFVDNISALSTAHKMSFWSPVSARAYLGGEGMVDPDKTALELFGGEYVWDKFTISLNTRRGTDRDYELHYGVNINELNADDDLDGVYTSFVLYWTGQLVTQENVRIFSDRADTQYAALFPYKRVKLVDWTNYLQYTSPGQYQVKADLDAAAVKYAADRSAESNPVTKIDLDVVAAGIQTIYLGDTIKMTYERMGLTIDQRMKVVSYEWDVLRQKYNRITLGTIKQTLASIIAKR